MKFKFIKKNNTGFIQAPLFLRIKKSGAGFTILEVLGAIFVSVLGLVGVMSLILQNIQVQYINKNNLIASQLAQEGLELVRNTRDNNWLAGGNWDNNISPGSPENYYKIDYTGVLTSVADISEAKLQLSNPTAGFYWHDTTASDPDTIFSRLITITQGPSDPSSDSLNVSCLVQWTEKMGVKRYTAETILYNWR